MVAGSMAATAVYLLSSKKKKWCWANHDYKGLGEEGSSADNDSSIEVTITQDVPVYEDARSSAIGSMYSRHKDATAVMSDSVDAICENIKVPESTNDEIDAVSDELDKMLSED